MFRTHARDYNTITDHDGSYRGKTARRNCVRLARFSVVLYGLQVPLLFGLVQSGPRSVCASGTLIIATGPALCSPLNGVGCVTSKVQPFLLASFGSLNQNPTWKVLVGARAASG